MRKERSLKLVAAITRNLVDLGFVVSRANFDGSSYTLRWPGIDFRMRVSDHAMSFTSQRRHSDIITNYIVNESVNFANAEHRARDLVVAHYENCRKRGFTLDEVRTPTEGLRPSVQPQSEKHPVPYPRLKVGESRDIVPNRAPPREINARRPAMRY